VLIVRCISKSYLMDYYLADTAMLELNDDETINPETLLDPRLVLINKYNGNPKFIDCSPFHRNVFLSGTTNGDLCIHNLLRVIYFTDMIMTFI